MAHPRIGLAECVKFLHPLQELRQFFLPGRRQQEIVESLKALALVRVRNGLPVTEDVV